MFYEHFVSFDEARSSGDQLYACCPFHHDTNASFTVNVNTQEWYCHGCAQGGGEVRFLELYYDVGPKVAEHAYQVFLKKGVLPFPTEAQLTQQHQKLLQRPDEVQALHTFGISDEVIEEFQLGWEDLRITIPIYGRTGMCVNIRKYLPPQHRLGEPGAKVIQIRGLGENRYFPYKAFDKQCEEVFVVEGEKDCLAARSQGLNAVTGTGGGNIPTNELFLFQDKKVYLMLDTDAVGKRAVKKYIQLLRSIAKEIHVITLPVKDFSDYYQRYGNADVLQYETVINAVEDHKDEASIGTVSLSKSEYVENLNSWVSLENVSVVGTDPKTYTVPKSLKAVCRDVHCSKPCAIGVKAENVDIAVEPRYLVQFLDSSDNVQNGYLRQMFGCRSIVAEPSEYTNAQKILFQETASFVDGLEDSTFDQRYGIYLYEEGRLLPTNRYNFEACRVTDPRTQQNYYVIRNATSVSEDLGSETDADASYFQAMAKNATSFKDLILRHYTAWASSLGIEGRPDLFAAIMLTYLSVTEIAWKGGTLKGWLDTMCIGDTRTGKSQMAQRIVKLLKKGAYINGENARRTGVIGGVQRFGDSWVITWGAIPMNDRGMLIIDEASGLEIEDVKELSAVRSSGAITINKIARGEAKARTRLLWLSNPRSGRNLEDFYWKGYGAFQEFIPVAEDQARFDLVLTAAREDVKELKGLPEESNIPVEQWRTLVRYAWNVPAEHINISAKTKEAIEEAVHSLDKDFGGGPLIVGVAVHEKLLRLSCAIAVLCGSIAAPRLDVLPLHVKFAEEFLRETLSKATMDYGGYIREYKKAQRSKKENTDFIRGMCATYPALKVLLSSSTFRGAQVREVLGIDSLEASKIISELLRRGLIHITGSGAYSPDKTLIDISKQMEVTV